jgi:hypothetical protein
MRDALRRRVVALEEELAARKPSEPALIWRCASDFVSTADRRAAANAAGERGTPNARLLFVTVVDASRGIRKSAADRGTIERG